VELPEYFRGIEGPPVRVVWRDHSDDRRHGQFRGLQRTGQCPGGAGHQLCHRSGRYHGERALGSAGLEGIAGSDSKIRLLLVLMFVLFLCGLALGRCAPVPIHLDQDYTGGR
jgi:hypothetical protein